MSSRRVSRAVSALALLVFAASSSPAAAEVEALLDLSATATGPFPTNVFTVSNVRNLSNRQVSLPRPATCAPAPAPCFDVDTLNTLDGFNMQPLLRVPFDGAIDVLTATSANVFLVNLGDTAERDLPGERGSVVGVNQVVFDPQTNTLFAESDALLRQHTRYALIVTNGVTDTAGIPVRGTALQQFLQGRPGVGETPEIRAYRAEVLVAVLGLRSLGISREQVVSASVFTTQSSTAILEKMLQQNRRIAPPAARFDVGTSGERAVFTAAELRSIVFNRQVTTAPAFQASPLLLAAFNVIPGSVGGIAFGTFTSPTYTNAVREIPAVPTRTGLPAVQSTNTVSFTLVLPAGPKPAAGWPIALFGHGFGGEKNNSLTNVSTLASQGIATLSINVVGHGGGALGNLVVTRTNGSTVTVLAGGRSMDLNGDTMIDATEGFSAGGLVGSRDTLRQTVADLSRITQTIRAGGLDVDGDGAGDFDPARVFYTGISLGGIYGTMLLGVEPNIRAGVPNVPGGVLTEIARLGAAFRPSFIPAFAAATPPLLNALPITAPLFGFNENIPLRNLPPIVNNVPGAGRLQVALDNLEWVAVAGDPLGFARHIRAEPLAGNSAKPLIFQFARGDMTVTNPTSTALVRAGEFQDRVTFFRNDLFLQGLLAAGQPAAVINANRNPHVFLASVAGVRAPTAIAAQLQIATFFASNGATTVDPDGAGPLFEVPIVNLPEDLGFFPLVPTTPAP